LRAGIEMFEGKADALSKLVRRADAAITGWDAGRPNHDIDIRALNPALVEVSVSTFGTYGPYAGFRGSPLIDWASGGYMYITGLPTREPLTGPETLPAYVTGYVAASAVEVGLLLRNRGVDAARLEVSTMEVMASAHQTTMSQYAATGNIRKRQKHPHGRHPLDIIECADGWVSVSALTDAQYDMFAVLVGEPQLVADERFATGNSRHQYADEFDLLVHEWFMTRNADMIVELFQSHQVPAARMADPLTVLDDPQLRSRDYWVRWSDGIGTGLIPGDPIRVREAASSPDRPPLATRQGQQEDLPLKGILVLDLTEFWAGPMATRILADLGATVVRIERPGPRRGPQTAVAFVDWKMQRGKHCLVLDIKSVEGQSVVGDLLKRADVFVENFRPGVMERLGFGYDDVAKSNPRIVYASLSGFGQDGPRASWASFGTILEAASSLQSRAKYPDSRPLLLGHALADPVGGFAGAFAVLNRLRARSATERGAYVDISQLETYTALSAEDILHASVEGDTSTIFPTRRRVFECRREDTWVAIEAVTDHEIEIASKALGCEASEDGLAASIAHLDKFEVTFLLQAHGLAAFPVFDASDLASDAHLRDRGHMIEVELGGKLGRMPTLPIRGWPEIARISDINPSMWDQDYILREILGYPDQRINNLLASGAISRPS
jgi:crotonobetainyl-CoA:carnitine CoA-transferase CaiB-like acyl-CoA transferase